MDSRYDSYFERHLGLYSGEIGEQVDMPGRQFAFIEVDGLEYLTQNMKKKSIHRDLCRDYGYKITWIKRGRAYVARVEQQGNELTLIKLKPTETVLEQRVLEPEQEEEDVRMSSPFTIRCNASDPAPGCKGARTFTGMPVDQRLRILASFIETGGMCSVCRDHGCTPKHAVTQDDREITFTCANHRCITKITCKRSEIQDNRFCEEHRNS